jgi:hypothetical protein
MGGQVCQLDILSGGSDGEEELHVSDPFFFEYLIHMLERLDLFHA